jgi:hypothetical protein
LFATTRFGLSRGVECLDAPSRHVFAVRLRDVLGGREILHGVVGLVQDVDAQASRLEGSQAGSRIVRVATTQLVEQPHRLLGIASFAS